MMRKMIILCVLVYFLFALLAIGSDWKTYPEFKLISPKLTIDQLKDINSNIKCLEYSNYLECSIDIELAKFRKFPCYITYKFSKTTKKLISVIYLFNMSEVSSDNIIRYSHLQNFLEEAFGPAKNKYIPPDRYEHFEKYWEINDRNFKLRVDHKMAIAQAGLIIGVHQIIFLIQ